ncbi:endonuclease/exonuclease/phosphatase family protein [Roseovarius rhodophyticola]|uniref:Endonuclease/exonuclease/phosphatase family protein n=1 Tax=Roseovarius rhodophyticola TaxID=3080827 RepID=A0ABZ2TKI0_9RHOB|nr:endonuclease/exonuclease/phosphatase family protein [Roseovarius sp. W115]MDV2930162.1 endonuclease/exonuclease/phosphatase family protein [Roseovarius sp. W115]
MLLAPLSAEAQGKLRIATYNTELSRDGPGLLLRDIVSGQDEQVEAVAQVIATIQPDVILLQNIDYDHDLMALNALRERIAVHGHRMLRTYMRPPNTGIATGFDMNGDGHVELPKDAQSYGEFEGQGGMAILSRFEVQETTVQDFSCVLWQDVPGALLPEIEHGPFPSKEALAVQRLSSTGHWIVPINTESGPIHLLAFHAGPPVFDGPEDRNGRRNHDEIVFWRHVMDGTMGEGTEPFVVLGNSNLDPLDGDGRKEAIHSLITDPRLQDPRPRRQLLAQRIEGQLGDPNLHTVAWPLDGPGHKRVSYVLPDSSLSVLASGVYWPREDSLAGEIAAKASRHRLVWVDVAWD